MFPNLLFIKNTEKVYHDYQKKVLACIFFHCTYFGFHMFFIGLCGPDNWDYYFNTMYGGVLMGFIEHDKRSFCIFVFSGMGYDEVSNKKWSSFGNFTLT